MDMQLLRQNWWRKVGEFIKPIKTTLDQENTKEPTGFKTPEDVIVTYNSTARTITLTGTVEAYFKGSQVTELEVGWVSDAHPDVNGVYFLAYTGTSFEWLSRANFEFYYLLISYVIYRTNEKFALRECHGMMQWEVHKEIHEVIGTHKEEGGTLEDYVLDSTTVVDRRASVTSAVIDDEDLETTNPLLPANGPYTNTWLTSTNTFNFDTAATDIVPLSGDRPYYNEFDGVNWVQTLMSNNYHMSIWLIAIPTTADIGSQEFRYIWVQGQNQNFTLTAEQSLTTNDVNLGEFIDLTPESVYLARVIIRYTAGNWKFIEVQSISGTRFSQSSASQGSFLSVVTATAPLSGFGTTSTPLVLDYNVTNFQITATELNTIQDIYTGSTPTFDGLNITNNIIVGGTVDGVDLAAFKTDYDSKIVNSWISPLQFSSNTASISQSGSVQDGYLSSTDWNTFNDKQDNIIWGDGLQNPTGTASIDYNITNLKITTTELDTIQDIAVTSSPTFANLYATDKIGIDNISPTSNLHIGSSTGDYKILTMEAKVGQFVALEYRSAGTSQWTIEIDGGVNDLDFRSGGSKFKIHKAGGISVGGDIIVTGNVDGVDLAAFKTDYDSKIVNSWTSPLQFASNVASILQAGVVQDGYLSSIDWNTFNDKEPSFSKNTAFNKNFGTSLNDVPQANSVVFLTGNQSITGEKDFTTGIKINSSSLITDIVTGVSNNDKLATQGYIDDNATSAVWGSISGTLSDQIDLKNALDAKQNLLTFGIADNNAVAIDSATVATNDYAKFTASGLEGRSHSEVKTDLSLNLVENTALSTWTGSTNIDTLGTITSANFILDFDQGTQTSIQCINEDPAVSATAQFLATSDSGSVYFGKSSAAHATFSGGAYIFNTDASNLYLATSSSIKMTITPTGYVGIGVTPTAYLDVIGSGTNSDSLRLRSGDVVAGIDSNQILFSHNGTALYTHAIKTNHDAGTAANNSINFYLWKYGTDSTSTTGTLRAMSIFGTGVTGFYPGSSIHEIEMSTPGGNTGIILNSSNLGSRSRFDIANHSHATTTSRYFDLGFNGQYPLRIDYNGVIRSLRTYALTTTNSANMYIYTDGRMFRSTCGEYWKEDFRKSEINSEGIYNLTVANFKEKNNERRGDSIIGDDIMGKYLPQALIKANIEIGKDEKGDKIYENNVNDSVNWNVITTALVMEMKKLKNEIEILKTKSV